MSLVPAAVVDEFAKERREREALERRLATVEGTLFALARELPGIAAYLEATRVVLIEELGVPPGSVEAAAQRFLRGLRYGPGTRPSPPGFGGAGLAAEGADDGGG